MWTMFFILWNGKEQKSIDLKSKILGTLVLTLTWTMKPWINLAHVNAFKSWHVLPLARLASDSGFRFTSRFLLYLLNQLSSFLLSCWPDSELLQGHFFTGFYKEWVYLLLWIAVIHSIMPLLVFAVAFTFIPYLGPHERKVDHSD